VGLGRSPLLVSFDAGSLGAARVVRTLTGRRLDGVVRVALAPGVLDPSPFESNFRKPEGVNAALEALLAQLPARRGPAVLVLPDGIARVALLEPQDGVPALDFARFRLAAALPYPAHDAQVDVLPVDKRRVLALAVRRSIVEDYEAVAREQGLEVERVEIASVAGFDGLRRIGPGTGSTLDLILGDAAYSIAAWNGGELRAFRSRRRDGGDDEPARLRDELLRTARLAGDGVAPRIRVVGPGASGVLRALRETGDAAEFGWQATGEPLGVEAAEFPWLGMSL
jgi:hypothetical protein